MSTRTHQRTDPIEFAFPDHEGIYADAAGQPWTVRLRFGELIGKQVFDSRQDFTTAEMLAFGPFQQLAPTGPRMALTTSDQDVIIAALGLYADLCRAGEQTATADQAKRLQERLQAAR